MTLDAKTNIGSTIQGVDQILKDFEEYYNKHIKDKEKGIEKVRLKYARTYQLAHRFFKWGLALSAFLMILSSRMGGLILEIFLSCAVLFFFLVFFLLNQKKLKMSQDYQYLVRYLILPAIVDYFPSFNYSKEPNDTLEKIQNKAITIRGDDTIADCIAGEIDGVRVTLFNILGIFQRNEFVTGHNAGCVLLKNHKKILSNVLVVRKALGDFETKFDDHDMKRFNEKSYVDVVNLENDEFNLKFKVLASDPVEVRYILSPALMKVILELDKLFIEKFDSVFSPKIKFEFFEDNILIRTDGREIFRTPKIDEKADFSLDARFFAMEMIFIQKVIDAMKLTESTY